jgi:hypothetical protein
MTLTATCTSFICNTLAPNTANATYRYRRDPYWSTSRGKGGLRLMIGVHPSHVVSLYRLVLIYRSSSLLHISPCRCQFPLLMRCSSKVLFTVFSVLLILACIKRTRGRSSNAPPRRGLTLPTSQQSPARTGWTIFLSGPPQDGRASSANVTRGLARPENAYYEGGHRMLDYTAPVGTVCQTDLVYLTSNYSHLTLRRCLSTLNTRHHSTN